MSGHSDQNKFICAGLVLICLLVVIWIRLLPLSLSVTDDWADSMVRHERRQQITTDAERQRPIAAQREADLDLLVKQWIEQNTAQFETDRATVAQQLKSRLRFTGKDGQAYVYLGDVDSYTWVRAARNYLRTGTTCDAVVDGVCRDTYTNAPVGTQMIYNRSLHIAAIIALHRLITLFNPDYPLTVSAFLVPVLVGALGIIPAFFIGRQLAGYIGGLCAALLIGLNPELLDRSIGSDNDAWNIVLPLFMVWAASQAMTAITRRVSILCSTLAGAFAALHALTWRGWFFTFAVLTIALLGNVILHSARYAIHHRTCRLWRSGTIRRSALIAAVFFCTAGLFTEVVAPNTAYLEMPFNILASIFHSASAQRLDAAEGMRLWPAILSTVGELSQPDHASIVDAVGGTFTFYCGLLGTLLLFLPNSGWRRGHIAVFVSGIFLYSLVYRQLDGMSRLLALACIGLPQAGGLILYLCDPMTPNNRDRSTEIIYASWLLSALYLAYDGARFLLFLGPPFGFMVTVLAGRLRTWLGTLLSGMTMRHVSIKQGLFFVLLALLIMPPAYSGYRSARNYVPSISDAWWDTLTKLRLESPPNAIVNAWWDYGYWIKYIAERRVSSDGGTLLTHVHHWLGKALIAPGENESIDVLRMLNCGSDATPLPEGRQGAYGKLLGKGYDAITAYAMLLKLIGGDRETARALLTQNGFTGPEAEDVLEATHCMPPPSYLMISSNQLGKVSSWVHFGLWDLRKVYMAQQIEDTPRDEVIADVVKRFGYSKRDADSLYTEAIKLSQADKLNAFIAPQEWLLSQAWHACRTDHDRTSLICELNLRDEQTGQIFDNFVFSTTTPMNSRLYIRSQTSHPQGEGTPATIILAGPQQMADLPFPSPTHPGLEVLLDIPNLRILIGSPHVIRSTFTHLMFLDGRYARHFEKIDDRTSYLGERIVTWRIHWSGR